VAVNIAYGKASADRLSTSLVRSLSAPGAAAAAEACPRRRWRRLRQRAGRGRDATPVVAHCRGYGRTRVGRRHGPPAGFWVDVRAPHRRRCRCRLRWSRGRGAPRRRRRRRRGSDGGAGGRPPTHPANVYVRVHESPKYYGMPAVSVAFLPRVPVTAGIVAVDKTGRVPTVPSLSYAVAKVLAATRVLLAAATTVAVAAAETNSNVGAGGGADGAASFLVAGAPRRRLPLLWHGGRNYLGTSGVVLFSTPPGGTATLGRLRRPQALSKTKHVCTTARVRVDDHRHWYKASAGVGIVGAGRMLLLPWHQHRGDGEGAVARGGGGGGERDVAAAEGAAFSAWEAAVRGVEPPLPPPAPYVTLLPRVPVRSDGGGGGGGAPPRPSSPLSAKRRAPHGCPPPSPAAVAGLRHRRATPPQTRWSLRSARTAPTQSGCRWRWQARQ